MDLNLLSDLGFDSLCFLRSLRDVIPCIMGSKGNICGPFLEETYSLAGRYETPNKGST